MQALVNTSRQQPSSATGAVPAMARGGEEAWRRSSTLTDPSACPASVSGAPAVPKRGGIRVEESATAQRLLSETDRKRLKQTVGTLLPARKADSIMEPNGNVKPALSTLTGVC